LKLDNTAHILVSILMCPLLQDVMKLDNTARINTPGVAKGNWAWRIGDEGVWERLAPEAEELRALAKKAFRCVMFWEESCASVRVSGKVRVQGEGSLCRGVFLCVC